MTTRLAPLLLVFALAAPGPARAVPITVYAFGHVTEDLTVGQGAPRTFAVGERVTVRCTYDLDPPIPDWGGRPSVEFEVMTSGGYSRLEDFATMSVVHESDGRFRAWSSYDPWLFDLQFIGDGGMLVHEVDLDLMSWGFRAVVSRTDTFLPVTMHAPEPSTMAMALIGGAIAAAWRRWT